MLSTAGLEIAAPEAPVLVTATIGITLAVAVATAIPKVLGPLAQAWETWTDARRRTQSTTRDAQLAMLREHSEARDKLLDEAWAEARAERERRARQTARFLRHELDDVAADLIIIRLGGTPPPRTPLFEVHPNDCPPTGSNDKKEPE